MSSKTKSITLIESLIPIIILIFFLAYNVAIFKDDATYGPNQFALIKASAIAMFIGYLNKISYNDIIEVITRNIKSSSIPILILLMVGSLTGTWLLSGVIPTMVYYGLQILDPSWFLAATVVITAIISIATGSSWTTSATIGVALIGIGRTLEINEAMIAGAVVSGAYFGDKMSPLSDTTNLASAMADTDLFRHIRYMTFTTVPSILITIIVFITLGFQIEGGIVIDKTDLLESISNTFYISPILFLIPAVVVVLVLMKVKPLVALFIGTILAAVFAAIFQQNLIFSLLGKTTGDINDIYKVLIQAITETIYIESGNTLFDKEQLFKSNGMSGMLNTIWLILCAMLFGGAMEAIGALEKISVYLLKLSNTTFSLFASTVSSCLVLNATASDQYLAIAVPGRMFTNAYRKKGLAPENLSRTLEDSGTATSVLFPWNTCGAYQSAVLGVPVLSFLPYAVFNYLSPFMTLLFAAFMIKIKKIKYELKLD